MGVLAALLCRTVLAHGGSACRFPAPPDVVLEPPAWARWYALNRDGIEHLRDRVHRRVGSGVFFRGNESLTDNSTFWLLRIQREVQRDAAPVLLPLVSVADSGAPAPLVAAACLAMARMGPTEDAASALMWRARTTSDPAIEEASILGLGLLRRSHAASQLPAPMLDDVRSVLLGVLEDAGRGDMARAVAALSLGLLGDQPAGPPDVPIEDAGRFAAHTASAWRLLRVLDRADTVPDLAVALLLAIGRQPGAALEFPGGMDALRARARDGRLAGREVPSLLKGHACFALGRLGRPEDVELLEQTVADVRGTAPLVRAAAAAALSVHAASCTPGGPSLRSMRSVVQGLAGVEDEALCGAMCLALVQLAARVGAGSVTNLLGEAGVIADPLDATPELPATPRPWHALALGRAVSFEGVLAEDFGRRRAGWRTLERVARAAQDPAVGTEQRRALILALGLSGESAARQVLLLLLSDPHADPGLRAAAAHGIGLIGHPLPVVTKALASALREPEEGGLPAQAAYALALLGNPKIGGTGKDAVALLLEDLATATSPSARARIITSLGLLGDAAAIGPLVAIVASPQEPTHLRVLSAEALGVLGDAELLPAMAWLRADLFPGLVPASLAEVLATP